MSINSSGTVDVANDLLTNNAKLKAIAESNTDTAVDVFVYDTRKDSDGGAWRKRTQNTSWYNETLNTSTRGARKEFPSVAVIVAESTQVTIYDGDDPDMPMWMVFNGLNAGSSYTWHGSGYGGENNTCASMKNGVLCIGVKGSVGTVSGLSTVSFIDEVFVKYGGAPGYIQRAIELRNAAFVVNYVATIYDIAGDDINDVAMTVLPNAPIDADTGLPVPTIAVATDGGVSVIKDNGSVVDGSDTASYISIDISKDYRLISGRNNQTRFFISAPLDTLTSDGWHQYGFAYSLDTNGYPRILSGDGTNKISRGKDSYVRGGTKALTLWNIKDFETDVAEDYRTPSLNCYITSDYNTGWMNGDIKLATLSDTEAADNTEYVGGYGDFTDGNAWTKNTGWSTGSNVATKTAGTGANYITRASSGTFVSGQWYQAEFDVLSGNGPHVQLVNRHTNGVIKPCLLYTSPSPRD